MERRDEIADAVRNFKQYIASQTLAEDILLEEQVADAQELDFDDYTVRMSVEKR